MTDMNLLADSYDAAADYIEQNGWHQGSITTIENESECTINEIVAQMRANKLPACAVGAAYAVGCSAAMQVAHRYFVFFRCLYYHTAAG